MVFSPRPRSPSTLIHASISSHPGPICSCRLDPPAPTSSAGTTPSSTSSLPGEPKPRRGLPRQLPPVYRVLLLRRPAAPPSSEAHGHDPYAADFATAAAKLRDPDQRRWFPWSHPPMTYGQRRPPVGGTLGPRFLSSSLHRLRRRLFRMGFILINRIMSHLSAVYKLHHTNRIIVPEMAGKSSNSAKLSGTDQSFTRSTRSRCLAHAIMQYGEWLYFYKEVCLKARLMNSRKIYLGAIEAIKEACYIIPMTKKSEVPTTGYRYNLLIIEVLQMDITSQVCRAGSTGDGTTRWRCMYSRRRGHQERGWRG